LLKTEVVKIEINDLNLQVVLQLPKTSW